MTRQDHSVPKMTAVWLLPVVPLIVASSSGGLMSRALLPHSTTLALVTSAFSFTMVITGLSFALMMITVYLLRLITSGAPDPSLILSAFITLGPLGQGGFSLLVNGQDLSDILPLHMGDEFPTVQLAGQMIFAGCFLGAYILFSLGVLIPKSAEMRLLDSSSVQQSCDTMGGSKMADFTKMTHHRLGLRRRGQDRHCQSRLASTGFARSGLARPHLQG